MGGTCGDIISAIIDVTGARLLKGHVHHTPERTRLKKPHEFSSDAEKDLYLSSVNFASVSSHDFDYHRLRDHSFTGIAIENLSTALWAAERFQSLHRPQVWDEMRLKCGAGDTDQYAQTMMHYSKLMCEHAKYVILLEDIVRGQAVTQVEQMLNIEVSPSARQFYTEWLMVQNYEG